MEEMRDFTEEECKAYQEFLSRTYIPTGKNILTDDKSDFATDYKKPTTFQLRI